MKNLIYSLLVVFTFVSCSKDDPAPTTNVEGNWNLTSASINLKSFLGNEDNQLDFENKNVYLDLKANNKFSSNIVMAEDLAEFIEAGNVYESDYEIKGDMVILQIYDAAYEAFVPVKLKIASSSETGMVLKMTKAELKETMEAYDKLDENTEFTMILGIISSLDATLTFTK